MEKKRLLLQATKRRDGLDSGRTRWQFVVPLRNIEYECSQIQLNKLLEVQALDSCEAVPAESERRNGKQ